MSNPYQRFQYVPQVEMMVCQLFYQPNCNTYEEDVLCISHLFLPYNLDPFLLVASCLLMPSKLLVEASFSIDREVRYSEFCYALCRTFTFRNCGCMIMHTGEHRREHDQK